MIHNDNPLDLGASYKAHLSPLEIDAMYASIPDPTPPEAYCHSCHEWTSDPITLDQGRYGSRHFCPSCVSVTDALEVL